MKIVVIGGSGLIGSKLVKKLRDAGHEVVAASLASGVNVLTGEGLDAVLAGADVVVDVSNSPSFEDKAVLSFFETSARNVLPAEARAGVKHHVALSIVAADRNPDSGYMRAKVAQERAIKGTKIPYTIVRATQFFEFLGQIADASTEGNTVRLPSGLMQPLAADTEPSRSPARKPWASTSWCDDSSGQRGTRGTSRATPRRGTSARRSTTARSGPMLIHASVPRASTNGYARHPRAERRVMWSAPRHGSLRASARATPAPRTDRRSTASRARPFRPETP